MADTKRAARIRSHNDAFRQTMSGGRITITQGMNALCPDFVQSCLKAVQQFEAFTIENDPYHEHDFGALTVGNLHVFFKIDYYEAGTHYTAGAEDPTDVNTTERVMTIMLAEEH